MDATGAGDAFCGSFLARIVAGDTAEAAARYAAVAAALKCEGYGAVAPIPRAEQVREAAVECSKQVDSMLEPPSFQAIYVASGEQLLMFKRGSVRVEPMSLLSGSCSNNSRGLHRLPRMAGNNLLRLCHCGLASSPA